MLRTQTSTIERFTQQISSVSTEQLLAGVKSLVWKSDETSEKLTKTENDQILKEVRPQEVKFFGANSKERLARIRKQTARMHSEHWDTGERIPIYKNLWECDINP